MNKEKEEKIDKLAIQICRDCDSDWCRNRQSYCDDAKKRAERLINAGYGNVKQAVKEFAEKIEKLFTEHEKRYSHLCKSKKEFHDETCRYQAILRLHKEITELYGADE